MKAIFTLLFIAPFCLFAQENAWFEQNTTWTFNYGNLVGPERFQVSFGMEETTLANKACVLIETDNYPFACSPVAPPYYFYESNDSIFFATETEAVFRLAYDFNAAPGDTWEHVVPVEEFATSDTFDVEVLSVSDVDIDGSSVKKLMLAYTNTSQTPHLEIYPSEISVLEYIGSTIGFFVPLGSGIACDNETDIKLQCFDAPLLDYTNPEFGTCFLSAPSAIEPVQLKIYPNPAKDNFTIDMDFSGTSDLKIMQLDGKLVYTETIQSGLKEIQLPALTSGMYIVEVKSTKIVYVGKLQIK